MRPILCSNHKWLWACSLGRLFQVACFILPYLNNPFRKNFLCSMTVAGFHLVSRVQNCTMRSRDKVDFELLAVLAEMHKPWVCRTTRQKLKAGSVQVHKGTLFQFQRRSPTTFGNFGRRGPAIVIPSISMSLPLFGRWNDTAAIVAGSICIEKFYVRNWSTCITSSLYDHIHTPQCGEAIIYSNGIVSVIMTYCTHVLNDVMYVDRRYHSNCIVVQWMMCTQVAIRIPPWTLLLPHVNTLLLACYVWSAIGYEMALDTYRRIAYPALQVQCALTIVPSFLEMIQASCAFWLGFTLAFKTTRLSPQKTAENTVLT